MTLLISLLIIATLIARALGAWRFPALASWAAAVRAGLGVLFLFTGASHFVPAVQDVMLRMMPPLIPHPRFVVGFTGLCEIAGGVGLNVPPVRRAAAWALITFLVAVFPANVRAARQHMTIAGQPATPVLPRAALQLLLIGLVWGSAARNAAPPVSQSANEESA